MLIAVTVRERIKDQHRRQRVNLLKERPVQIVSATFAVQADITTSQVRPNYGDPCSHVVAKVALKNQNVICSRCLQVVDYGLIEFVTYGPWRYAGEKWSGLHPRPSLIAHAAIYMFCSGQHSWHEILLRTGNNLYLWSAIRLRYLRIGWVKLKFLP